MSDTARIEALEDKIKLLEKRLSNTETAIMGYHTVLRDTLPTWALEPFQRLAQDFFNASSELGGLQHPSFIDE